MLVCKRHCPRNILCFSVFSLWLAVTRVHLVIADCSMHNFCNGHGSCIESTSTCACYEGWGATSDITFYRAPDCSARVCPNGRAWADVPTSPTTAHAYMECSNRGSCDRVTGLCSCFAGFTGAACDRTECPNSCSGENSSLISLYSRHQLTQINISRSWSMCKFEADGQNVECSAVGSEYIL